MTLACRVRGSGPALLLVHGGGGSAAGHWGPLIPALSKRYTVIAPDLPGCGATPRSARAPDLDDLADELLTAAGATSVAIAAFSMGCPIAIRAAARCPERVSALILICPFIYVDARLRMWLDLYRTLWSAPGDALARFIVLALFGDAYLERLDPAACQRLIQRFSTAPSSGVFDHFELLRDLDVRSDLARITAPLLALRARQDHLAGPQHVAQLAAETARGCHAEIDGGHLAVVERPHELVQVIERFLCDRRR